MDRCYVYQNGSFQVVSYDSNHLPDGFIADVEIGLIYKFPNGIVIVGYMDRKSVGFRITIEKHSLAYIKNSNPACVVQHMNHYATLDQLDIEKLLEQVQESKKTELELEIEQLRIEKSELEECVEKLKRIMEKKEELNQLLKDF